MVWMFGNGFGLQYFRNDAILGPVARQFTHAAWEGMYPWDLIQPFFMFIVGVAMPFAFAARQAKGDKAGTGWGRVLRRSALLVLCGLVARSIPRLGFNFDLINVLGQLAFTYVFAYAVLNAGPRVQAAAAAGLLILHTGLHLQFQPSWERDTNFGAWVDRALLGKNWGGGYATVNFLSSGANTIFGVMAGWVLIDRTRSAAEKIRTLVIYGAAGIVGGLVLWQWIPLIKKIWTASFAVYSTGFTLLALAFFYWLLDVRKTYAKPEGWSAIFAIVGANSIFIYMFHEALYGFVLNFGRSILGAASATNAVAWLLYEWAFIAIELLVCYRLYQRRIFLKL
jgi:predicted acyltransferase